MSAWSVRLAGAANGEDAERSGLPPESRTFVIEDSLGYLVNRMARLMAHELAERIRPAGVAIGQWSVLLFLWARDGMTQAELSRMVAIEPPTVVRTIDRMVRDGLVIRAPDPDDGRLSRIYLTERGDPGSARGRRGANAAKALDQAVGLERGVASCHRDAMWSARDE
jgi:hypothetical protein